MIVYPWKKVDTFDGISWYEGFTFPRIQPIACLIDLFGSIRKIRVNSDPFERLRNTPKRPRTAYENHTNGIESRTYGTSAAKKRSFLNTKMNAGTRVLHAPATV